MLTLRDIAAIRAVAHYHVLSRAQLQKLCYPTDRTGRATRKRLDMLVAWRLLNRTPTPIFNRRGGSPWPAYYPSPEGCDLLAHYFEDENYLLAPTCAPPAQNLLHSIEVSDVHITFDDGTVKNQFLSWKAFRQLLAMKLAPAKAGSRIQLDMTPNIEEPAST